jgi:uncharacterized protein YybS (DUF2232 family)
MVILGLFLVILVLPAMVIPKNMALGERPYKVVLEAFLAAALGILFVFILTAASGMGLGEQLAMAMKETVEWMVADERILNHPLFSGRSATEIQGQLISTYTVIINSLPGTLLVLAALSSYFEYILIAKIGSKGPKEIRKLPHFRSFSWPRQGIWGWLAIFIASWIFSKDFEIGALVLSNVNVLMEFYFVVQGAAVVFFFGHQKKWPGWVPPLAVLVLSVPRISRIFLFILGVTDLVLNLRDRMERPVV